MDEVAFAYEEMTMEEKGILPLVEKESFSPLQIKYSKLLDVEPTEITNISLYEFVDKWTGTPYLLGGNTENGVDCSSFTQRLFTKIYDKFIGRTAQQMYNETEDKFEDLIYLEEGDLVFFNEGYGSYPDNITHVGVYLAEGKFINATSRNGKTGVSGVKISDLKEPFWLGRFRAGGRVEY